MSSYASYRVIWTRVGSKQLKNLPKQNRKQILDKIDALLSSVPVDVKKIKGRPGMHRVRSGNYRAIIRLHRKTPSFRAGI